MLSVLIPVFDKESALAETLASLVSGVVTGVIRSVLVADFCGDPGLRALCEECGCDYSDAQVEGLQPAIATLRDDLVMVIAPGVVLIEPWLARLREFRAMPGDVAALFPLPLRAGGRWFARFADRWQPIDRRAAAVILPRRRLAGRLKKWSDLIAVFKSASVRVEYAHCIADLRHA